MADLDQRSEGAPPHRSITSIVGWVWGGFSIGIGGLMLLNAQGRMYGVAAVAGGLLLLPPVVAWLRRYLPMLRPTGVPAVFGLGVGVLLFFVALSGSMPQPPETDPVGGNAGEGPSGQERTAAGINAMWSEVTTITQRCDEAASDAASALDLSRSNAARAYAAVQAAKTTCANVGLQLMAINPPPSLDRQAKTDFEEALNNCGLAYAGKSVMFDRMLMVVDGDRRPSRLAAVQQAADQSQSQTVQCVIRLSTLAEANGVSLDGETARH